MNELDVRGLSCPEPLMLVHDAIKKNDLPVKVLADEEFQKNNIEKLASKHKKNAVSTEGANCFEIVIS